MKRKILMGLAFLTALTVSGVLLASAGGDQSICDDKVNSICQYEESEYCYFYLKGQQSRSIEDQVDRCWYNNYKFSEFAN